MSYNYTNRPDKISGSGITAIRRCGETKNTKCKEREKEGKGAEGEDWRENVNGKERVILSVEWRLREVARPNSLRQRGKSSAN